jgi:hypothetical protein
MLYIVDMKFLFSLPLLLFSIGLFAQLSTKSVLKTDVLVIGAGTGGTAAAIQCARLNVKTVLIESTPMLGGMLTASGVSCTDGNDQFASGIWQEFREGLYQHYKRKKLNTGWVSNTCFEPKVGDSIFKAISNQLPKLAIYYGYDFITVLKKNNKVTGAIFTNNKGHHLTIYATIIIDGTDLGDVMANAGALYDLGMDDPTISKEKEAKEKNTIVQDLTWAAILKDYGPNADVTIAKPVGYDPKFFYCTCTDAPCYNKSWNGDKYKMLNYGKLPRSPGALYDKYMLNWPPNGNDIYLNVVTQSNAQRIESYALAKQHTLRFIYFIQTELGMKNIGLANDELDGGLAFAPYHREGRRMKGRVRMNLNHIKIPYDSSLYRTGIAVGDYPVDHHHSRYPGAVPEIAFPPIPAYNVPMGALIPASVEGLLVCDKSISVTNLVNGTTRLQPVVLLTGQAAGVIAAIALQQKKKISEVDVRAVQQQLLKAKCYLMPFSDVKINDPHWEAIQKVGLTGILKGTGKAEGWANKMFFYPDSVYDGIQVIQGLKNYKYAGVTSTLSNTANQQNSTINSLFVVLTEIVIDEAKEYQFKKAQGNIDYWKKNWTAWGLTDFDPNRNLTRREVGVLIDKCLYLFDEKKIKLNLEGQQHYFLSKK